MKVIANLQYPQETPQLPVWLTVPDSAIIRNGNPFFVPDFDTSFSASPFLAIKICRLGKSVAERFASRYFDEATLALLVFADSMLKSLRNAGLPWTAATCFDRCCILGDFFKTDSLGNLPDFVIRSAAGIESFRIPSPDEICHIVSAASANNTIKTGDLILLPLIPLLPLLPSAPGKLADLSFDLKLPMQINSRIVAALGDQTILKIRVK